MSNISLIEPSYQFAPVTPHDVDLLTYHSVVARTRGIYVAVAGNLAVIDDQGTAVTFTGVTSGVIHPIATSRINATNTTALGIIALF